MMFRGRTIVAREIKGVSLRPQAERQSVLAFQSPANHDGRFREMQGLLRAYANTFDDLLRKLFNELFAN